MVLKTAETTTHPSLAHAERGWLQWTSVTGDNTEAVQDVEPGGWDSGFFDLTATLG